MVNKRMKIVKLKQFCIKCDCEAEYNEKYDCYYCIKCNIWLEPKCGDLFCLFCKKRPTRPLNKKISKVINKKKKIIQWKI
jgi:hypothetical protein